MLPLIIAALSAFLTLSQPLPPGTSSGGSPAATSPVQGFSSGETPGIPIPGTSSGGAPG
jgi:hypothetical protein